MPISAEIIADAWSHSNIRLTTFRCQFPKFILAELNTHRMLSRNSASSRAIPIKKVIKQVFWDPVIPVRFGMSRAGMQDGGEASPIRRAIMRRIWLLARLPCLFFALLLLKMRLHKQVANRILEPWMYVEVIISGTNWRNFFTLRTDKAAQPEMQQLALKMLDAMCDSIPRELSYGDWHIPYKSDNPGLCMKEILDSAVAKIARVSYNKIEGDLRKDLELAAKLSEAKHWSPFEHVAECMNNHNRYGNFVGFKQYRQFFTNEDGEGPNRFCPEIFKNKLE